MAVPYRCTSGRMLHFQDSSHFDLELPAREATAEELRTLPVCSHLCRDPGLTYLKGRPASPGPSAS